MFVGFHENAATPLIIFGVASLILVLMMVRNSKSLRSLEAKISDINHAVNGQPDSVAPMVEKVNEMHAEQIRVAAQLTEAQDAVDRKGDQLTAITAEQTRVAAEKVTDRVGGVEDKVDTLLRQNEERDVPDKRYGHKGPNGDPVD